MISILVVVAISVLTSRSPSRATGDGWDPLAWEKIDIHTHFYQDQPFILPVLDAVDIRRAAILCYAGMDNPAELKEYEERIVKMRDTYPDRCQTADSWNLAEGYESLERFTKFVNVFQAGRWDRHRIS
jgi:hypothetical protein